MPKSRHLCVFVAEIVGGDRLVTRLGEEETTRALERCLNRIDFAISGSNGEVVARDRSAVIATFEHCDEGVIAACEAIERVRKLPPVSGTHMRLRTGLHYGEVENGMGDGVDGARLILLACDADQSLASAPVIDQLEPAVRKFASAEAFHDDALGKLPWPVFSIGSQNSSIASSTPSLRPRPQPSSPLISLKPKPAAQTPIAPPPVVPPPVVPLPAAPPHAAPHHSAPSPAAKLSTTQPLAARFSANSRMRLKHQQDTMFVDENRPVVLLGRELGNDIVIIDPRASRQHARIERRRDGFVLIDESTNGCFVAIDGHEEQCLKCTELPLTGSGRFGCGFSSQEFENDLVFFEFA
jgi:hypothetical protein